MKNRSIWWRLHQLAGLQMSLLLSFIFITGTFAVLSHEIDWLMRPAMWVSPVDESERVSWGQVARAVGEYDPQAEIINIYDPLHAAATFDVVVRQNGELGHIYVHPGSAAVTGEGSWVSAQRLFRDAHRRLFIYNTVGSVRIGILIVCLTAIYLLITFVTSFWVYKKWWRGFFRLPKGKGMRAYVGDLHRWAGLWSLWFVLIMVWTSLWYLVEEFTGRPALHDAPVAMASAGSESQLPDQPAALDNAINNTLAYLPDYDIDRVLWPSTPEQPFRIFGQTDRAILVNSVSNSVWADSDTGALQTALNPADFNLRERLYAANNPLHYGTFAGYISKSLYFVFGLILSGLSVTGVMVYGLRLAKAEKVSPNTGFVLRKAWYGMGAARWPALILTLVSFIMAPIVL
jgi:uncharacterized iron-regulated membrane protein